MNIPKEYKILEKLINDSRLEVNILMNKIYMPYSIFNEMVKNEHKLLKIHKEWYLRKTDSGDRIFNKIMNNYKNGKYSHDGEIIADIFTTDNHQTEDGTEDGKVKSFRLWAVDVYPHPIEQTIIIFYCTSGIRIYENKGGDKKWEFVRGYVNHNNYESVDFGLFGKSEKEDEIAEGKIREFTPVFQRFSELKRKSDN